MPVKGGRPNQRGRTRRDLLEAALRASSSGKTPNLDDIAEEARVSRATAYRYFPNVDDLLAEASLHVAFPDPSILSKATDDVLQRLMIIDEAVEQMVAENETALRTMIASANLICAKLLIYCKFWRDSERASAYTDRAAKLTGCGQIGPPVAAGQHVSVRDNP